MLRHLAPCGSGHRNHTSVATPERRAALISRGLPRQQGSLLPKVNERTGEWGIVLRKVRAIGREVGGAMGPPAVLRPCVRRPIPCLPMSTYVYLCLPMSAHV